MHVLMSCVKDEGPFVLEFVAHHLALGFDRILIASNDCSDGTDVLLAALHRAGFVQHLDHSVGAGEIPQHVGYARLRSAFGLRRAEWLMVLDVDEFLHVSQGDGSVQALTAAAQGVDIIALNAQTYGTIFGGQWQPGLVCGQFTYRLKSQHKINAVIKSLTRAPKRFLDTHNHHMARYRGGTAPLQVMRGNGLRFEVPADAPLWTHLRFAPAGGFGHDLAHYNHYAIKTLDSYQLRRARGRGAAAQVDGAPLRHTDEYFAARMLADIPDDSIGIYAPRVAEKLAQMLAIPAVAAAQKDCEARYGAMVSAYHDQI